jgi:hypothetical protein
MLTILTTVAGILVDDEPFLDNLKENEDVDGMCAALL